MPRNITVTFDDGSQHVYQGAPDDVTPEAVAQRAQAEFGKSVRAMDGGRAEPSVQQPEGIVDHLSKMPPEQRIATVAPGLYGIARGVKDAVDTGAEFLASGYDKLRGRRASDLVTGYRGEAERVRAMNERGKSEFAQNVENLEGPASVVAGGGRVAGNILATYPIGGAIAAPVRVGAKAVPALAPLADAIATGGMRAGGMSGAKGLAVRSLGGAITGGASAAAIEPDSATSGAVIGGLMPGAVTLAGKAGQAISASITNKGARQQAVRRIASELGDDAGQAAADIQTYYPKGAEEIPVSAAGITANPKIARMEQGSRLRTPAPWYEFDQAQGRAVADNVMRATKASDDLGARLAQRAQNWADNWSAAEGGIKPKVWSKRMGQLGSDIEQALKSPEASNPDVRRAIESLRDEVIRVGEDFSPAHLQQIRANFNGRTVPGDPNAFRAAPRDSAAVKSLIAEMDDILNASTGGRWDKVRGGYAADSQSVHASKAAGKVREAFVDPSTGRVRGVSLDPNGDVPKITEAGLGRAMDSARLADKSLALSPESSQRLGATLEALRRQNIVQGVKRSSTSGGGSDTLSNSIAANLPVDSKIAQAINALRRVAVGRQDDAIAWLFAHPDELASELQAAIRPRGAGPISGLPYRAAPVLAADQ